MKRFNNAELIEKCKNKLIELRTEYKEKIDSKGKNTSSPNLYGDDLQYNSSLHDYRLRILIEDINHALQKMNHGTYGICERTGKYIDEKRLLAVPWTKVCIRAIS